MINIQFYLTSFAVAGPKVPNLTVRESNNAATTMEMGIRNCSNFMVCVCVFCCIHDFFFGPTNVKFLNCW